MNKNLIRALDAALAETIEAYLEELRDRQYTDICLLADAIECLVKALSCNGQSSVKVQELGIVGEKKESGENIKRRGRGRPRKNEANITTIVDKTGTLGNEKSRVKKEEGAVEVEVDIMKELEPYPYKRVGKYEEEYLYEVESEGKRKEEREQERMTTIISGFAWSDGFAGKEVYGGYQDLPPTVMGKPIIPSPPQKPLSYPDFWQQ